MTYIEPLKAENSRELARFIEIQELTDKPFLFHLYCEGVFYYRYTTPLAEFYEVEIIAEDSGMRTQVMMGSDFIDILLEEFETGYGQQEAVGNEQNTLEITIRHYESINPKNNFAIKWGNYEE